MYYSVGAYITYSVGLATGSVWVGIAAGVIVGGLAALAVERIVFRRIYDRDLPFTMITSFGVLIGGVGVIKYFWGLVPRPVAEPIAAQVFIVGTEIPIYRLIIIGIAALVYVGIWLFLNRTIIGKAIRAGTEDVEHVEGLGINVYRLFTITFVIAGGLSGLAGGLQAPLIMVDPQMGLEVLAFVFMVVIIGGLGSIKGTLVSSIPGRTGRVARLANLCSTRADRALRHNAANSAGPSKGPFRQPIAQALARILVRQRPLGRVLEIEINEQRLVKVRCKRG